MRILDISYDNLGNFRELYSKKRQPGTKYELRISGRVPDQGPSEDEGGAEGESGWCLLFDDRYSFIFIYSIIIQ